MVNLCSCGVKGDITRTKFSGSATEKKSELRSTSDPVNKK